MGHGCGWWVGGGGGRVGGGGGGGGGGVLWVGGWGRVGPAHCLHSMFECRSLD